MNTKDKIKVMQAYLDGELVQFKAKKQDANVDPPDGWSTALRYPCCDDLDWMWGDYEYRIKPNPRVVYMNDNGDGSLSLRCFTGGCAEYLENDPDVIKFVEVVE